MAEGVVERYITVSKFKDILKRLLRQRSDLVGPVNVNGEVVFQDVDSVEDIVFDFENCINTPKDYVLMNDEILFRYDLQTLKIRKPKTVFSDIVIFGARPCDTKALHLLDRFFSKKYEDPLYFEKRKKVLIITLVCNRLGPECFCTSVKSGPYLEDGFDLQLTKLSDGFYIQASSQKGKAFIKRFARYFEDISPGIRRRWTQVIKMACNSKDIDFNIERIYKTLADEGSSDQRLWQELGIRCQSCGGCLLICPTCSCFYVVDRNVGKNEGYRARSLDACYYEGFTRMAGGYNPINSRAVMMKRKFYHKLYQQLDEFGEPGCVGCGRCNQICPGNVNWLEVIKKLDSTKV